MAQGHKTGFYLDQRDNRRSLRGGCAASAVPTVLNCYSYTGGFTRRGAGRRRGAGDQRRLSAPALALAGAHVQLNGFDAARHERSGCRRQRTICAPRWPQGRRFDAIVLDPPKFAPTAAQAERAARAYKDINRLAPACC